MKIFHRYYLGASALAIFLSVTFAQKIQAQVPGTLLKVTFQRTISTNELNEILNSKKVEFAIPHDAEYVVPDYTPALYPVDVYKIAYSSRIPEQKNRKTVAYGMIAIPKVGEQRYPKSPKLISYQHGTIFGKYQSPSYAFETNNTETQGQYSDGGYEDRLVTAVFAGQGNVVIAADYFGFGDSLESEAFSVKGCHQQACLDCYLAASSFLTGKGIRPTGLFLSGWSLGGLVTLQFLEKLEDLGYPVTAASTAAAPSDPYAGIVGMIFNPSQLQAPWANTMLIFSVFSYEMYYSQPGLAKDVLNPEYYERCKQIYDKKGTNSLNNTYAIIFGPGPQQIPSDLWELVRPKYHDPLFFASSPYAKYLQRNEGYRWFSFTPLRMYYGNLDQVVSQPLALLAQNYDHALGNTNITTYLVPSGNHRGTFLQSVAEQKTWFDSFSGTP